MSLPSSRIQCMTPYKSHSGKNAPLNAFRLKHDARHCSLVFSMSSNIPIASSPSASHFSIILSTEPRIFRTPRENHGRASIASCNSALSSLSFLFLSSDAAAHRIICGRDGHFGSSGSFSSSSSSSSSSSAVVSSAASLSTTTSASPFSATTASAVAAPLSCDRTTLQESRVAAIRTAKIVARKRAIFTRDRADSKQLVLVSALRAESGSNDPSGGCRRPD
mmetsp:Transcript_26194/g.53661  ORF Transcript_26194/g.53661 Transcript_26194/m.53661 type:complete len:221 (+) Transcript_26194:487-1149(+)